MWGINRDITSNSPIENSESATSWNLISPGSSASVIGNNGGRIVSVITSDTVRPSACDGAYTSSSDPARSSGVKNGSPCTWSQWR